MSLFEFEDLETEEAFHALVRATDGTEPCYDPLLAPEDGSITLNDSPTDRWVEPVAYKYSSKTAQEMCAGCHIIDQCREYAILAGEATGVWGGTTPRDRGIPVKYKGGKYVP